MRARHRLPPKLPGAWLFTDERQGEALWAALERLPRGAGVVFRHYRCPDRAALAARVRAVCRRRGLLFVVAGPPRLARAWRADGAHGAFAGALTAPAHDAAELVAARRAGARLAFLSPLFATRSHPGARPLGALRFARLARGARLAVAALGGVGAGQARRLRQLGAVAWGAIDAWHARAGVGLGPDAGRGARNSLGKIRAPSSDVRDPCRRGLTKR
jgi:thiamine-phosphate pyrophosphorylase